MKTLVVDNNFIDEVINRFSDMLIRIAYQNLKNYSDAEDVVQEVLLKLIQCNQEFNNYEHVKAWLIRCIINRCKDHRKSAWFRKTTSIQEGQEFPDKYTENKILDDVWDLPVKYRNIIYLYYYEGYKINEIGELLGKSTNTINSQLQRARSKLKLIMEEEGEIL